MINLCKIVPAISQLVLYRELEEQIRSKDIPHKFFYWDFHCSDLWRILADSSHFQTHNQFACLLDDKFNEIHNVIIDCTNKKPYDLISDLIGNEYSCDGNLAINAEEILRKRFTKKFS